MPVHDPLHELLMRLRESGADAASDEQLLERYVRARDAAAFEVLVWRHGRMVRGVASRLLDRVADADDAFQAAFLTLARRAGAIRRGDLLAAWLHRVTCRIAQRLRRQRQSRELRERPLIGFDIASRPPVNGELAEVLDIEIGRLPERQHRAVVLCYLEGRTAKEAASALGCPRGTILSRLAAARRRLRAGLRLRGIAPALGSLTLVPTLTNDAVAAAVALAVAIDRSAVPANIASLSDGVIRAMFLNKYRLPLAGSLFVGFVALTVGVLRADKPKMPPSSDPPSAGAIKAGAASPKIEALLIQRRDNLRQFIALLANRRDLQSLPTTGMQLISAHERLLEVEIELGRDMQQRLAAYERSLTSLRLIEENISNRVKGGLQEPHDGNQIKDAVLRVEIAMLKEQSK